MQNKYTLIILLLFLIPFTNASSYFYNSKESSLLTNSCSGTDQVYKVEIKNDRLKVYCSAQGGGDSGGDNASWNEDYADSLYYPIDNPDGFITDGNDGWTNTYGFITGSNNITYQNWNKTYADTLYPSIIFGYNMTNPFTTWLTGFLYNYNQTSPFTTWLASFVYNYNQTYSGSTLNTTYSIWAYNQSIVSSTYNSTYHTSATNSYNHTSILLGGYSSQFNSTFNSTYNLWAYNQSIFGWYNNTLASNTYTDSRLAIDNQHKHNISNITFIPNCAAGQFLTNQSGIACATPSAAAPADDSIKLKYNNITAIPNCGASEVLTNRTGSLTCVTDQTGGASSTVYRTEVISTNATGLTFVTLFTIPLSANTNYTIDCLLLRSSNATTSGIRYNITLAGVPDWMFITERVYTSATAAQTATNQGAIKHLMPTAVTASLAYPTQLPDRINIFIDGNANTGGNAIFQFSGELANLLAVILRGSYCEVKTTT